MNPPDPQAAGQAKVDGRTLRRDLISGVWWTIGILVALLLVERTSVGNSLHRAAYRSLLHHSLGVERTDENLPVIIDISDMPNGYDNEERPFTPRDRLRELIAIVTVANPRAIGIDIDFSPRGPRAYVQETDPAFLRSCLWSEVPIILGVYRNRWQGSAKALGDAEYRQLAGAMTIPVETWKMSSWIEAEANHERLPSFSAALASVSEGKAAEGAVGESGENTHGRWASIGRYLREHLVENTSVVEHGGGRSHGEFLNNLNPLDEIVHCGSLRAWRAATIKDFEERFRGRIVIIGTMAEAADKFVVPGREEAVPGIALHACGVYTLLNGSLYELHWIARISLDLTLSGIVLLGVHFARVSYLRIFPTRTVAVDWLQRFFTLVASVIAALLAYFVFTHWRVMWIDFPFVIIALALHRPVEHFSKDLLRKFADYWQRHAVPV